MAPLAVPVASHHGPGRLSLRLLGIVVLFAAFGVGLVYVPAMTAHRTAWLQDKLTTAGVAAAVLAHTAAAAPELRAQLLSATGAVAVSLRDRGVRRLVAMRETPQSITRLIVMRDETWLNAARDTLSLVFSGGEGLLRVVGDARLGPNRQIDMVLPERQVRAVLLRFSRNLLAICALVTLLGAAVLYLSLQHAFVRPLERLTRSMASFSSTPESAATIIEPSKRKDEIGEAERWLAKMQTALSDMLRQRQRLAELGLAISKINHDLRGLLSSVRLFLENLENAEDIKVRQQATRILRTLDRAVDYTDRVLSYGLASTLPRRQCFPLAEMVSELEDLLDLGSTQRPALIVDIEPQLLIDADPEHLFRVLLNLLRNAIQAIEKTGRSAAHRITVAARRQTHAVEIFVSDTGGGIDPLDRERLFKPFQVTTKSMGSGLGLAIASDLVGAHGGKIEAQPNNPHTGGAVFRIVIPDRASAVPVTPPAASV